MIAYKAYVDFDNDGSFATAGDDITAYVTSLQASLGMEDEQAHVATVGFCQVTLNNASKRFSPEYASGAYYGKLLPRLPFKVDVVEDGNTYTLFRGVTSRWYAQSGEFGPREAMLEAECLLSVLQSADMALPLQVDATADELLKLVGSAAFQTARAEGYIDFAGNVSNNDTVTVGDVTYTFKTALTSPAVAGEVLIGADATESAENLIAAINGEEGAGTTYSTGTERADVATASLDGEYLEIKTAGVAQGFAIGRFDNGNMYHEGQRLTIETGGVLSQIELWFGERGGAPTGTVKWAWYSATEGTPGPGGTLYESGTFTPSASEPVWNTITPAGTTYLTPAHYFLYLAPNVDQTTGNYWVVLASDGNAGDVYADGAFDQLQADPPGSWTEWAGQDMTLKLTLAPKPRVTLAANARGAWGNSIALEADGANLATNTQLITDGDMEAADASAWSAYNSGALSKETGTPHGGSNVLRVTENGADYPSAYQADVITTGNTYRLTGWARGDGNANPFIFDSAALWTGTSSTDWQRFDVVFTAVNDNLPSLASSALNGTGYYIEWDDVVLSSAVLSGGVDGPVGLMSYETGRQTFPFAADNWTGGNTNGLRAVEEAVTGEWGYLWAARDGTITFKNRDWLFQRQLATAVLTFDSEPNMIDGSVSIEDIANRVTVSYTPRRVLDSAVVARAADGIRVSGKRELRRRNSSDPYKGAVITLPYVDPDGGQLVGAQNLVHPVPGTDYRVTWGEAGVGVDRSGEGFVTCTVARNAADAEVVFQNTHTRSVFVHDFQLRAEAITRYNRLQAVREDTDSIAAYGAREMEVELPLYSQQTLADSIAGYLASRYAEPAYRVPQIALRGRTTFGGVNVYSVELGDVVAVTDDQTGLDGARFVVLGYTAMLERGGYHELNWTVRRLDDVQYFILDHATYSLLNGTNRLSI
jgi:hypothetical protein